MSRSKNELLLIAFALFVMASVCLYSVFNPKSLKAVEVEGGEVYQIITEQTNSAVNSEKETNGETDKSNRDGDTVQTVSTLEKYEPIANEPQTGVVNLNTASLEQIMTLDGIGETKAQAIIDYREEHGGFMSTQEIMSVKGIGEKTFEKIKDRICV